MLKAAHLRLAALSGLLVCLATCAPRTAPGAGPGPNRIAGRETSYDVGGPLAGEKLPLYKTQQGEQAGYPGCIPELAAQAKAKDANSTEFTAQGQHPEAELYPDAAEHYRIYWEHYLPPRSFFDRQSQLKLFTAQQIAGAAGIPVEQYSEPVYWEPSYAPPVPTGRQNKPVPVIRCKAKTPVFKLDFGELGEGLYAVRVVGAVETKNLRPFRLPAFVGMRVNDGLAGEVHQYRVLAGYVDEFYGIAEVYFHAPARRAYSAELWFDDGTQVDVLVQAITLDDVLAGTDRRAIKTKALTMELPAEIARIRPTSRYQRLKADVEKGAVKAPDPKNREQRWTRDALLWNGMPDPNRQGAYPVNEIADAPIKAVWGVGGKSLADIEQEFGKWEIAAPRNLDCPLSDQELESLQSLLVNRKLNLKYTIADLEAGRPLPDPYPYKDTGAGIYTPDPNDPKNGQVFWPIGAAIGKAGSGFATGYLSLMNAGSSNWVAAQDETSARDAALALIRFAYQFPTLETDRLLAANATDCWHHNRVLLRRREAGNFVYGNFIRFLAPVEYYDRLFGYIQGNEDLAQSVHRFVPWVKTSQDVVKLLDVYLVQTLAKRVLRYQYVGDGRQPWRIAELSSCMGDNEFTRPWMEWLFTKTFFYPQPLGGLADYAITGTDRDGRSPIGSFSYMIGEFSADLAASQMEKYIRLGGNPKYDLRDPKLYPKTRSSMDFYSRIRTAGMAFPRIGDVAGPDKQSWQYLETLTARAPTFWNWTQEPRYAWIIKNRGRRTDQTDEEWAQIEAAAATVKRAPWFDNESRILAGWGAFLETGVQYDDLRFRRSAMVRIGQGWGHQHYDGLDLQLYAFGLPMTIDGGQRSGYCQPGDSATRVHNTVQVDDANWLGYSWAQALTDAPGARYMSIQAAHPKADQLFRRQVALVDVDEGRGAAQNVGPAQMGADADPQGLPPGIQPPNSYVFDVFRVAGGASHAYCFHGTVNDAFEMNAANLKPIAQALDEERQYMGMFGAQPEKRFAGDAPETLEATWRLKRGGGRGPGGEQSLLGRLFDPASPPKFTRLHLLDAQGCRAFQGEAVCTQWGYQYTCFMARRTGNNLESVFPAVIEPYAGEPVLASQRLLPVAGNEADALRAVAVEVKTKNGHTDICFADGRPEKVRTFNGIQAAAEYAFHSVDEQGLRLATLTGGTLLNSPLVRIQTAARERTGRIARVDYGERKAWINGKWAPSNREQVVEVGAADGYITSCSASQILRDGDTSALIFRESADYYRSLITHVDPEKGVIACTLNAPGVQPSLKGVNKGFVASNDARTKFWRADVLEPGNQFRLTSVSGGQAGAPVTEADFAPEGALRLWEYGVGDLVRQSSFAVLRRVQAGAFQLDANVGLELSLKAATVELCRDGKTFAPAGEAAGEWRKLNFAAEDFSSGAVLLRVKN